MATDLDIIKTNNNIIGTNANKTFDFFNFLCHECKTFLKKRPLSG